MALEIEGSNPSAHPKIASESDPKRRSRPSLVKAKLGLRPIRQNNPFPGDANYTTTNKVSRMVGISGS